MLHNRGALSLSLFYSEAALPSLESSPTPILVRLFMTFFCCSILNFPSSLPINSLCSCTSTERFSFYLLSSMEAPRIVIFLLRVFYIFPSILIGTQDQYTFHKKEMIFTACKLHPLSLKKKWINMYLYENFFFLKSLSLLFFKRTAWTYIF